MALNECEVLKLNVEYISFYHAFFIVHHTHTWSMLQRLQTDVILLQRIYLVLKPHQTLIGKECD